MDSEALIRSIKRSGIDAQLEAFYESREHYAFAIENSELKRVSSNASDVLHVRSIYKGKSANVLFSIEKEADVAAALRLAYKLARAEGSSDCQTSFSKTRVKWTKTKNISPYKTSEVKELYERALRASKHLKRDTAVHSINSFGSINFDKISIANDFGVSGDVDKRNSMAYCDVVVKNGREQATGDKYTESVNPDRINFARLFSEARRISGSMLGAKSVHTFTGEVLIDAECVIGIIESLLDAASGEEVLKGRSFLAGKKDSLIGSDKLYMAEENRVPNSPYNREFDDELTPTKRKMIVERGVLKSFLHNIYSAEKLGEDRTGNGFLGGGGISTGFTNIKVYGEKFRKGDLLSKVKHGVYMLSTGDRANESTGDLSAMVTGYYVKDGKIVHPLKETMIGINLIELLSNVSAIGEDFFMAGGINTPSLLVDNVKISGRA